MLNQGGTALDYEYAAPTTGGSAPAPAYAGFGDAFGGVTAYYSLRQFTEAETLNAIRVRRSSDDTEQDIGFDANGDLDTTALLAFVNSGKLWDTATDGNLTYVNRSSVENNQSVGGRTGVQKFTSTDTNAFFGQTNLFPTGDTNDYTIELDVYIPTGQDVNGVRTTQPFTSSAQTITQGEWTTITITGVNSSNVNFILNMLDDGSNAISAGQVVYVDTVTITQTTADGAVTTWYDQSGNGNDATNSTESEQPLVVSAGTLVEENSKAAVDFDGVDDNFDISNFTSVPTISQFNVLKPSATNVDETFTSIQNATTTDGIFLGQGNLGTEAKFGLRNYQGADIADSGIAMTLQQYLLAAITTSTTAQIYANGVAGAISAKARGSVSGDTQIGANGDDGHSFSGKFQELIIFDSDQSANRGTVTTGGGTGIEGNINTYFDIV